MITIINGTTYHTEQAGSNFWYASSGHWKSTGCFTAADALQEALDYEQEKIDACNGDTDTYVKEVWESFNKRDYA